MSGRWELGSGPPPDQRPRIWFLSACWFESDSFLCEQKRSLGIKPEFEPRLNVPYRHILSDTAAGEGLVYAMRTTRCEFCSTPMCCTLAGPCGSFWCVWKIPYMLEAGQSSWRPAGKIKLNGCWTTQCCKGTLWYGCAITPVFSDISFSCKNNAEALGEVRLPGSLLQRGRLILYASDLKDRKENLACQHPLPRAPRQTAAM